MVKSGVWVSVAVLIGAASVWLFLTEPPPRIPPGWSWRSSFVGSNAVPDPQTGEYPEKNSVMFYDRVITIQSGTDRPEMLALKDDYLTRDPATQEVIWRYSVVSEIDPATGLHLNSEHRDDYAVFPRNVDRGTYRLRTNYLEGIPVSFIREEVVEGLDVFLFGYEGAAEYTESYLGTEEYPGMSIPDGHEIRCADDEFSILVWVEPLTGETVKIAEQCLSGDYIYEIGSGEPVFPVSRWAAQTTGDDVIRLTEWVRGERAKLRAMHYGPFVLAALGLGFALAGYLRRRTRS